MHCYICLIIANCCYRDTIRRMPKLSQSDPRTPPASYETVPLEQLRQGRRGKHHKLVDVIIAALAKLPDNEAMKIPLETVQGVSLANLRSAVTRATKSRGVKIATFSDGESLFLWKRTAHSGRYERKRSGSKK